VLTILGRRWNDSGHCDGLSRRGFLTVGGMALGGVALPHLLAMEARAGLGRSHKAVINVFLPGGPPHLDMWDLKPDAPVEIRGEFNPIPTNVPGIEICEQFPKLAGMMDKLIPIRSIVGAFGGHDAYQCMTGLPPSVQPAGGQPAFGAWVSKVQGPVSPSMPAHLSLMYTTGERRWGQPGNGGFLGKAHAPFGLVGGKNKDGVADLVRRADNMVLQGITLERLSDRENLRRSLDGFRREADATGAMGGLDVYTEQALGILTSSKLAEALDLSEEDPRTLERYGRDDAGFERDGAPRMVRNFCIARRLVEAGARVVSMNFSRWDWHGGDGMNFVQARKDFPLLDNALSALVQDLHDRGLNRDVSVVVWGEFGRTPKINKNASRDHWPQVSCAMMAGGGMRTGQVIGATNRYAEHATDRPVQFQEVFATLYHNLGVNLRSVREFDLRGRPHYPVEPGIEPMRELV
jgi:hypothetical protein